MPSTRGIRVAVLATVDEAASILRYSRTWVRRLCRQGRIAGASKRAGVWFMPLPIRVHQVRRGKKAAPSDARCRID